MQIIEQKTIVVVELNLNEIKAVRKMMGHTSNDMRTREMRLTNEESTIISRIYHQLDTIGK